MHDESYETPNLTPDDEALIDYLLGESPAGDGDVSQTSAEIERWLAADEANVRRLESLAAAVLAAADHPWRAGAAFVEAPVPVAAARRLPHLRFAAAAALAASVLLAAFWSRPERADEPATGPVALAWAEHFVDDSGSEDGESGADRDAAAQWAGELPGDSWDLLDAEAWEETIGESDETDGPPEWLIAAVAQMNWDEPTGSETDVEAVP